MSPIQMTLLVLVVIINIIENSAMTNCSFYSGKVISQHRIILKDDSEESGLVQTRANHGKRAAPLKN